MSGEGCEYSIKASVTALPSTADFAFHFSAATRRKEESHGAGFEADTSGLLFTRHFGRSWNGFGGRGFGSRGFSNRGPSRLRFRHQFRRLQPFGRLPQAFQVVELAGVLGGNMDDGGPIVKQHPLRLFVGLCVSDGAAPRLP